MFWTVTRTILAGCGQAGKLFFFTLLFALPLGLVLAFGSMSQWRPFRATGRLGLFRRLGRRFPKLTAWRPVSMITDVFVWVIRGTPLMLQLIIIFYTPGKLLPTNPWNSFSDGRMFACVVAFVINYACYFSVIYKGGIEGVPAGQREAGEVLGMTRSQIFFKVTLQRGHHPGEGHLSGPGHRHHRDHQGRRVLQQVRGTYLAPVLHGGVLPGLCGTADAAV